MEVVHLLLTALAQNEVIDHARVQWARTIEGEHGDDVLEPVGLELHEVALHALALHLEDGRGVGLLQHGVGGRVIKAVEIVELQGALGPLGVEAINGLHRKLNDGEVAQAQEVELHQARSLHIVLVIHAHDAIRALRARRLIEGAEVGQSPWGDEHPTGVHANVAGEVL